MRSITSVPCIALLLAASGTAAAQDRSPVATRLGFELLTSGIERTAADSAGIGHRAWGVQFTGNVIAFRVLSLNADGGLLGMSDEDAFTQNTTEGEKTSSVAAGLGTLSAGLRTPPLSLGGEKPLFLSAGVNAGHTWVNVNRDIANCPTCAREDVRVQAGGFWEPALEMGIGPRTFTARYRAYLGGSDFQDALMIGLTTRLRGRTPPPAEPAER